MIQRSQLRLSKLNKHLKYLCASCLNVNIWKCSNFTKLVYLYLFYAASNEHRTETLFSLVYFCRALTFVTLFLFSPINLSELKIKRISLVRCTITFENNFWRIQLFLVLCTIVLFISSRTLFCDEIAIFLDEYLFSNFNLNFWATETPFSTSRVLKLRIRIIKTYRSKITLPRWDEKDLCKINENYFPYILQ